MGMRQHGLNWMILGLAGILGLVGCNDGTPGLVLTPSASPSPRVMAPSPSPSVLPTASPTPTPPAAYRIATVAGDGIKGDADNGQVATASSLFSPTGVTQGPDGSL